PTAYQATGNQAADDFDLKFFNLLERLVSESVSLAPEAESTPRHGPRPGRRRQNLQTNQNRNSARHSDMLQPIDNAWIFVVSPLYLHPAMKTAVLVASTFKTWKAMAASVEALLFAAQSC